ncbi:hypothetical protein ABZ079_22030 [Streptomyces sp. NPDC006314]|uniref:hypothetical protein n=1 Tax=Streptomyces sp. NPDC006314 TaxID=3154475 RepID=UPI0033AA3C87
MTAYGQDRAPHPSGGSSSAGTRWAGAKAESAAGTPQYTAACSTTVPVCAGAGPLRRGDERDDRVPAARARPARERASKRPGSAASVTAVAASVFD